MATTQPTRVLVSPTEPKMFRDAYNVSSLPEENGVDFLIPTDYYGMVGVQRKVFPGDFLASMQDGRLAKEIAQMQSLNIRILVLEGRERWTTEGKLMRDGKAWGGNGHHTYTKSAHRKYLLSVRSAGVWVERTDDSRETAVFLGDVEDWTSKETHSSILVRPGPQAGAWGSITNRDYQSHLVQGLPGVGVETAKRILDHCGMPFTLRIGLDELLEVEGIGIRKAQKIMKVFEREEVEIDGPG